MKRRGVSAVESKACLFIVSAWTAAGLHPGSARGMLRGTHAAKHVDAPYDELVATEVLESILAMMEEEHMEELDLSTSYGLGMAVLAKGDCPPFGDGALHLCARLRNDLGAALLLESGADCSRVNAEGVTALELSQKHGEGSGIFRLLSAAAAISDAKERRTFACQWVDDAIAADAAGSEQNALIGEAQTVM